MKRAKNKEYVNAYVQFEWDLELIHKVQHAVPVSILQLALNVHDKLPGVTLWVDTLQRHAVPADPFLCVKYGESPLFYIAVWDEPGFQIQY